MTDSLEDRLTPLRRALLELNSIGHNGFEGVLASVFSELAQLDFRLARAGLQSGKDGEGSDASRLISYEAKLYSGKLDSESVLAKLPHLAATHRTPDVWALATTSECPPQIQTPIEATAERFGFTPLILDWPDASPAPPLAAACSAIPDKVADFLRANLEDMELVESAGKALALMCKDPAFQNARTTIQEQLRHPTIGLEPSRHANRLWLTNRASDPRLSRRQFGQDLAALNAEDRRVRQRSELAASVRSSINNAENSKVIAVTGGEGSGKSWLVAQSWAADPLKPLLIHVGAGSIKPTSAYGEMTAWLIDQILLQTGAPRTDAHRRRWERRLAYWKDLAPPDQPRFVVWVDGLNENLQVDWSKWIDGVAATIQSLGGRLIITCRTGFFDHTVRPSALSTFEKIETPEWTDQELREILDEHGVDASTLNSDARKRLRNPRLLAIALKLLNESQISDLGALTIERLIFEHLRTLDQDGVSPGRFSADLARHAAELIDRLQSGAAEPSVFDRFGPKIGAASLPYELQAVVEERYFSLIADDPSLYELSEDGIVLALGIALLRRVQRALRAGVNADEALLAAVEPLAALDLTAQALFAALVAASLDHQCNDDAVACLMSAVLTAQNLSEWIYPGFCDLVRRRPSAACRTFEQFNAINTEFHRSDWLLSMLRDAQSDPDARSITDNAVDRWLRTYSLNPDIQIWAPDSEPDKQAEERAEAEDSLKASLAAFSEKERDLLSNRMRRDDSIDSNALVRGGLCLLAGRTIADRAEALVAAGFSITLNGGMSRPDDPFIDLIRFNSVDWLPASTSIRQAVLDAFGESPSETGLWTQVLIHRALATEEDFEAESRLIDRLVADRPRFRGGRLVERYASTDPCDPDTETAPETAETAKQYSEIPKHEVAAQLDTTSTDHFFRDARCAMARFAPEVAIDVHRDMVMQVLERDPTENWRGLARMEPHASALGAREVDALVGYAKTHGDARRKDSNDEKYRWMGAQYALVLAFPHLTGAEQIEQLSRFPAIGTPLLKLIAVLKPAPAEAVNRYLQSGIESGDANLQYLALGFAAKCEAPLCDTMRASLRIVLSSNASSMRSATLEVIAKTRDPVMLGEVGRSPWSAADLADDNTSLEQWYGSACLVSAAQLIGEGELHIADRIAPSHFGRASVLGPRHREQIVAKVLSAIATLIKTDLPPDPPTTEERILGDGEEQAPLRSLSQIDENLGPEAFFKRLSESQADYAARQKSAWGRVRSFEAALSRSDARMLLDDFGQQAADAIATAAEDGGALICQQLTRLTDAQLKSVKAFAVRLATSAAQHAPEASSQLFKRIRGIHSHIRRTYGRTGIELETVAVWRAGDGPLFDALQTERIRAAASDDQLACEALAAMAGTRWPEALALAKAMINEPAPAAQARGLALIGFGPNEPESVELLGRFTSSKGFAAEAARKAHAALLRHQWAEHWLEKMLATNDPEVFWRHSVLFLKLVDIRFELFPAERLRESAMWRAFGQSLDASIERRMKSRQDKRQRTLCGSRTPSEAYVVFS